MAPVGFQLNFFTVVQGTETAEKRDFQGRLSLSE